MLETELVAVHVGDSLRDGEAQAASTFAPGGVAAGEEWFDAVRGYERDVLLKR